MLKLPKGLKKKKKGKKSKHKDDELFTQEELEAYRKEHSQQQQHEAEEPSAAHNAAATTDKPSGSGENEEWRKFLSLTSDVDVVLKKTQDDLDRIKSSSFFKRVPPPSEVRKQEEEKQAEERAEEEAKEEEKRLIARVEAAIVQVSESESEEEDEDDIFDTAYIDAVASGEVKLAYIPESPTDQPDDDIFDTTYAEKAILGPTSERKGKKLVPLGSAVEILTGRVQAPSCVSVKRPTARRQVFLEKNLLLTSFDSDQAPPESTQGDFTKDPNKPSLLDDDAPEELAGEPIDLAQVIVPPVAAPVSEATATKKEQSPKQDTGPDILEEFGVLQKVETPEDEDDQEFALLAAESVSKPKQVTVIETLPNQVPAPVQPDNWSAFGQEKPKVDSDEEPVENDPFDTTFAENILPGQAELKQIEREVLDSENDLDFNPRADEVYSEIIRRSSVSIQLTNPSGQRESVSSLERVHEDELNTLNSTHRDLLGGSNTDLSQLGEAIQPKETEEDDEDNFDYSDPFDTSAVDAVAAPGTTELKFLERELLGEQVAQQVVQPPPARPAPPVITSLPEDDNDDFDPRAFDAPVPSAIGRKVSFDLPLPKTDLLSANEDDSKVSKPLTPYYVRANSIPEQDLDPFDTTFAESIAPGQAELKQIESALLHSEVTVCDFNPRDEKQIAVAKVKEEIEQIIRAPRKPSLPLQPAATLPKPPSPEPLDLLGLDNDIGAKVLTPSAENKSFEDDIDPFDTSIASNILPGQTELRLLESELITNAPPVAIQAPIKRVLTDPDFDPRDAVTSIPNQPTQNILEAETGQSDAKLLTPITGKVSFDVGFDDDEDDIDPFDTSIANNIAPGPSELKLLESELI